MATFLFDSIIFGPVSSRRLGVSLGVNLLPNDSKLCNFNCIYCECGWTPSGKELKKEFHTRELVRKSLEEKLSLMKENNEPLDAITFAGNGEPTIHPDFCEIIQDTVDLRNKYFPNVRIAVLSNATMLHKQEITDALNKADQSILKVDSAFEETAVFLDRPTGYYNLETVKNNLKNFKGEWILQTMFVKGSFEEKYIDNSTDKEVNAWLKMITDLNPNQVMIYTIARDTPTSDLEKVSKERLDEIAGKVEDLGFKTQVSY